MTGYAGEQEVIPLIINTPDDLSVIQSDVLIVVKVCLVPVVRPETNGINQAFPETIAIGVRLVPGVLAPIHTCRQR